MKDAPTNVVSVPLTVAGRRSSPVADYVRLTKPRLNVLVVATSAAGYYLGGPATPNFAAMAQTFLPRIKRQLPGTPSLWSWLHVTKGVRSEYDHLMLGLHDQAKADLDYQKNCPQQIVRFAPGTTWLCFSDQVMHAAVSGQHMLEQTIHLPVRALYDPASAPLAILERDRKSVV